MGGLLNRKMGWALLFQWYFIDIDITHHIYGSLLWLDDGNIQQASNVFVVQL